MSRLTKHNPKAQMVLGLLVVVIGLLFLVDNLGWIDLDFRRLIVPTVLLVVGVLKLTQARSNSGNVIGVVLVCVGAVGILRGIGFLDFEWRDIWPVVLIIAGIGIVYKASNAGNIDHRGDPGNPGNPGNPGTFDARSDAGTTPSFAAPYSTDKDHQEHLKSPRGVDGDGDDTLINFVSMMGTSNRRVGTQHFRGGEVTAILGSADLDLRQASIDGTAVLNVFSLVGGITIKVPVDWVVVMEGSAIIGGFEEKTAQPTGSTKRLVVRGYAILGGLEIRN